jgi:nitroreductase
MVDVLLKRRSCRKFIPTEPVPKADIDKILEAGRSYACAFGKQGLEFVVLHNQARISELGLKLEASNPDLVAHLKDRKAKYSLGEGVWCDAPLVIFANYIGANTDDFAQTNSGIAILNLIAAAEQLGYATLPVMMASVPPQNATTAERLGITTEKLGISVAIGKRHPDWAPDPKKEIAQVRWIE